MVLASTSVAAQESRTLGEQIQDGLTKENIGRALGAGVGALIGSQVGGGSGRVAAIAAGTLAGFWLGGKVGRHLSESDQRGLASTTQTALETGQPQTWRNPDTGVETHVAVHDTTVERRPLESQGLRDRVQYTPPMEVVNAFYTANTQVNVRGGPGTDYAIMDRIRQGQQVPVVGRVKGQDWFLISDGFTGSGFVYAPLFTRSAEQPADGNAVRAASAFTHSTVAEERTCSLITQEVRLPDGTSETRNLRACQRSDGTWETV
jgi:surface antigen